MVTVNLNWLSNQEYLGRGFLIGQTEQAQDIVVYFVTGRSESSRARKLEFFDGAVKTLPTNQKTLQEGNPFLLIYNAIIPVDDFLIVGNGTQTDLIHNVLRTKKEGSSLSEFLAATFSKSVYVGSPEPIDLTSYEPDPPNFTPRISGILHRERAAIAIIKNVGGLEKQFFEFPLSPGQGKFISTYTGQNVPRSHVIPSFAGEPLDLVIEGNLTDILEKFYHALGPKFGSGYLSPGADFRVGVAAVIRSKDNSKIIPVIKNRC